MEVSQEEHQKWVETLDLEDYDSLRQGSEVNPELNRFVTQIPEELIEDGLFFSRWSLRTDDCHLVARVTDFIAMRGRFCNIVAPVDCAKNFFDGNKGDEWLGSRLISFNQNWELAGSQRQVFVP